MFSLSNIFIVLFVFICWLSLSSSQTQIIRTGKIELIDAIENETIRLPCRFNMLKNEIFNSNDDNLVYFWMRKNHNSTDNVAFKQISLDKGYVLDIDAKEGKYDLLINSASYYRDNGSFECRVKRSGTGEDVKSIFYQLVILIAPGQPVIRPEMPITKENEPFELTCYSSGGSPSPEIEWFRNGVPISGELIPGVNKDVPTKSVLKIIPSMSDDRLPYSCRVHNRAIPKENATEAHVFLTVYYTPRVIIGPYNPLNVFKGDNAYMTCSVHSNPAPKRITWYRNNKIINSNMNHTIYNIEPSDTGSYTCVADNGIQDKQSKNGAGEIHLNVLYAPIVTLPSEMLEPTVNEQIDVTCEVNSNPKPHTISWYKILNHNNKKLVQEGAQLTIRKIKPEDAGFYVCIAENTLRSSENSAMLTRSANSTIEIKVKHAPEHVVITPENPVAISGRSFNLTCKSQPEAHPKPNYKWWKEGDESNILSNSAELLFKIVHVRQEGKYLCSAENELGISKPTSVDLIINEPPSITFQMQPEMIKKQGERGFSLTCRARGKPAPKVTWYHNNQLIANEQFNANQYSSFDDQYVSWYRIEVNENFDNLNSVESILHFESQARNNNDELVAQDHGRYYCLFDNGLTDQPAKAETFVKVEHAPILKHEHNRVAFDIGELAVLQCKMSAYPKPSFEWYFENRLIDRFYGSQPKYNFTLNEVGDDIWVSTLFIQNLKKSDYGDYTCRSWNALNDDEKTIIKLVEKSAPEAPSHLTILDIQSDNVLLNWQAGFNGGYLNTEFILSSTNEDSMFTKWRNETCRTSNPCKLTSLHSRKVYHFKVMANNAKGHSGFSETIEGQTKVSIKDIPNIFEAYYDNVHNMVTFKIDPNDLDLLAKIEVKTSLNAIGNDNSENDLEYRGQENWQLLITSDMKNDVEHLIYLPVIQSTTQPSTDKLTIASSTNYNDMRISICLKSNATLCSLSQPVKMDYVATFYRENRVYTIKQLVFIILTGGGLALGSVLFIFMYCVKKREKISSKKDYDSESESENRAKVNTISNNYYTHDSKALVDSTDDSGKMLPPPMYTTSPNTPTGIINNGLSQNMNLTQAPNFENSNYFLNNDNISPNSSNETAQSELWMMKNELIMSEHPQQQNLHYGTHQQDMIMNGLINSYHLNSNYGVPVDYSYSYYPRNQQEEYQTLSEDNYNNMNVKNAFYAPYYEENEYGRTAQVISPQPQLTPPLANQMNLENNGQIQLDFSNQQNYHQQLAFEEETGYSANAKPNTNPSRVIREIIV